MLATKYQRVVVPCSHHSRTIGAFAVTNSIAYLEGQKNRLHLPPDGRVERD